MYSLVIRNRNVLNIAEQVSLLGTRLKRGERGIKNKARANS